MQTGDVGCADPPPPGMSASRHSVLQIAFLLALLAINLLPEHDGARWFAYFTNMTNVTCPAVPLIIDLSGSLHGCCRSTRICIRCLQSHAPPEMA